MGGCKAPITTFIVEPFVPHDQEYYLSIVSERLGCTISFSECGGIEIEENWDKVGIGFSLTSSQYCNYIFSSRIRVANFICFVFTQVKTIFLPTEKPLTPEACAPLIATLPLEVSFIYNLLWSSIFYLQTHCSLLFCFFFFGAFFLSIKQKLY